MKRLLLALSLAALSAPAWADTARPDPPLKYIDAANHPFATPPNNGVTDELPFPDPELSMERFVVAQSSGNTRSDTELSASSGGTMTDQNPWSRDHNFIAPPP